MRLSRSSFKWLCRIALYGLMFETMAAQHHSHYKDLPGIDDPFSEIVVPAGIMVAGAIIAIVIPTPSPKLHLEKREIVDRSGTLGSFAKPVKIE